MSFKILKNNCCSTTCCGLDVHKTWIFACIGITDSHSRTEYKQARFSSFSKLTCMIRTVPGFDKNPMTALQMLSEIGGDMSVFPTAKNLVSWAGYCPRNDPSNQKIKSTRISRAGSYFKPVLVQIANALIRSKKNPEFTTRYRRIKARRGHKKAIIAICRMLLTAIWHILTDLKPYTPEGLTTTIQFLFPDQVLCPYLLFKTTFYDDLFSMPCYS